jgi:putative DNA primase/helicase
LSAEAKQIWIQFHDDIESELRQDGELADLRDVASKAADNAARLAALFHLFTQGFGDVSAEAMKSATTIVAWHLHEARRLLPHLTMVSKDKSLIATDQWLIKYCKQNGATSVAKNDLLQKGPIRNAKELDRVLAELVNLYRIRIIQKQRITVEVNPALLGGLDGTA